MKANDQALLRTVAEAFADEVASLDTMLKVLDQCVVPNSAELRRVMDDARALARRFDAERHLGPDGVASSMARIADGLESMGIGLAGAHERLLEVPANVTESSSGDGAAAPPVPTASTSRHDLLARQIEAVQQRWKSVHDGLSDMASAFEKLADETRTGVEADAPGWTARAFGKPETPDVARLVMARKERQLRDAVAAERVEKQERHRLISEVLAGRPAVPAPRGPVVYRPWDSTRDTSKPGRVDHFGNPDAPEVTSHVPAGVVIVVNDNGELLVIRRTDTGRWALPGGAVDPGESAEEAAVREVWEETGVDCEIILLQGVYTDPGHRIEYLSDGEVRSEDSTVYVARQVGGEPTPSSETSEVGWVAPEDFLRRATTLSMFLRGVHYVAGIEGYSTPPKPQHSE